MTSATRPSSLKGPDASAAGEVMAGYDARPPLVRSLLLLDFDPLNDWRALGSAACDIMLAGSGQGEDTEQMSEQRQRILTGVRPTGRCIWGTTLERSRTGSVCRTIMNVSSCWPTIGRRLCRPAG